MKTSRLYAGPIRSRKSASGPSRTAGAREARLGKYCTWRGFSHPMRKILDYHDIRAILKVASRSVPTYRAQIKFALNPIVVADPLRGLAERVSSVLAGRFLVNTGGKKGHKERYPRDSPSSWPISRAQPGRVKRNKIAPLPSFCTVRSTGFSPQVTCETLICEQDAKISTQPPRGRVVPQGGGGGGGVFPPPSQARCRDASANCPVIIQWTTMLRISA